MKKNIVLLSVAAIMAFASSASSLKNNNVVKEELDTRIIVELKGNIANKSREQLINQQNEVISSIRSTVSNQFKVDARFTTAVNAFVLDVNSSHVSAIRNVPGVRDVNYDKIHSVTYKENDYLPIRNAVVTETATNNISRKTMEIEDGTKEGEGTLIAILDSSFMINATYTDDDKTEWSNVTHACYTDLDSSVNVKYTQESIKAVIDANSSFHGKYDATHSTYYNAKVPFFYDYGGDYSGDRDGAGQEDYDVFSIGSDHGNHVASIAAGNDPLYKGIAPKAQLALMKVFTVSLGESGYSVGAYDTAVLKALEDCAILKADVVNMSLGSTLSEFDESSIANRAIKNLQDQGCSVNISAGNDGKDEFRNSAYEYWTTDMVETGILGSYAFNHSMGIASAEPDQQFYETALKVGDTIVAYRDQVQNYTSEDGDVVYNPERALTDLVDTYHTNEFDWVKIPGLGNYADFEELEKQKGEGYVAGKIAIIDRGDITFALKILNATKYFNAIAVGIIDNDPTQTDFNFRMAGLDTKTPVPVFSILYRDKATFDNAATNKCQIYLNTIENNPKARTISDFSSDGVKADLTFKPDITAPGTNIFGAVYANGPHSYDYYSGTSMSAPNSSGAYALALSEHLDDPSWKATLNARLMSTASPMKDRFGENFEGPRKQGAGMINVKNALASDVIFDGSSDINNLTNKAKLELKNNDDIKNGKFNFKFTAINNASAAKTYKATTYVYQPAVVNNLSEDNYEEKLAKAKNLMANYDSLLVKYEENVTIPAGKSLVSLSHELTAAQKSELDKTFENGVKLEGFVIFTAQNETTISIPFLGFYGDYSKQSPVEPFRFERDDSKVYTSDLLNSVIHSWKGLNNADYASDWVMGNWNGFEDLSMESFIKNEIGLRGLVDGNKKQVVPVGTNPYTGEIETNEIYMGNNGATNTMVISQFVNRSVETNTITITNKATDEVILTDHMFDSFYGATEDDSGNDVAWPLFKSFIDTTYWSPGYIAHRAYTIIPLYHYTYNEATEKYTYGDNYPDGEYTVKFSYTLAAGGTFTKEYTLHIDSTAPQVKSIENIKVDGEDGYRIRYDEIKLSYVSINGKKFDIEEDQDGYYIDIKVSDYSSVDKVFVKSYDFAYGTNGTLTHLSDKRHVTLTASSFVNSYDFVQKFNNYTNPAAFNIAFTYTKSGKTQKVDEDIQVAMDISKYLENGSESTLKVYEGGTTADKEIPFKLNGNILSFVGNSNSTFYVNCNASQPFGTEVAVVNYTISFDGNGAEGTMNPITVEANDTYALPNCGFEAPEGKEFAGWTVNGQTYQAGEQIVISANTVVTANWKDAAVEPVNPDEGGNKEEGKKGCGGNIAVTGISMVLLAFVSLGALFIKRKAQ